MQFIYHKEACAPTLLIKEESYTHLFKSRRHKVGDTLVFRNLVDPHPYVYKVQSVSKKEGLLTLDATLAPTEPPKGRTLHIGWCLIDPKTVEKTLPMLNELGVAKLSFITCARSQKNFKLNHERMERILIGSCEQCGRSSLMKFEFYDSMEAFLALYPKTVMLHFCDTPLDVQEDFDTFLIGPEGGFAQHECAKMGENIRKIGHANVLRSETAITAIASVYAIKGV